MKPNEVTKEEFDKFIKEYPNELITSMYMIGEPPSLEYNDFSDGKVWPESVVASKMLHEWYNQPNTYFIKEKE